MAKKEVFTCDVCGEERKEANHWFVSLRVTACAASIVPQITFYRWPNLADLSGTKHLCGQVCAHKLLDEFMGEVSK